MAHPSTRTNNNNLNGKETNIGESIIIPKDISIDAITISITKNGKNNKNPIWKAGLSSEVIKAGSITEKGTSPGPSYEPVPDMSENIERSFFRVFLTMNSLI